MNYMRNWVCLRNYRTGPPADRHQNFVTIEKATCPFQKVLDLDSDFQNWWQAMSFCQPGHGLVLIYSLLLYLDGSDLVALPYSFFQTSAVFLACHPPSICSTTIDQNYYIEFTRNLLSHMASLKVFVLKSPQ